MKFLSLQSLRMTSAIDLRNNPLLVGINLCALDTSVPNVATPHGPSRCEGAANVSCTTNNTYINTLCNGAFDTLRDCHLPISFANSKLSTPQTVFEVTEQPTVGAQV